VFFCVSCFCVFVFLGMWGFGVYFFWVCVFFGFVFCVVFGVCVLCLGCVACIVCVSFHTFIIGFRLLLFGCTLNMFWGSWGGRCDFGDFGGPKSHAKEHDTDRNLTRYRVGGCDVQISQFVHVCACKYLGSFGDVFWGVLGNLSAIVLLCSICKWGVYVMA